MARREADVFRRCPNLQFDFQLLCQGAVYLQYKPGVRQRIQIMERSSRSQMAWKNHSEGSYQRRRRFGQLNLMVYPRESRQRFHSQTVDAERYGDAERRSADARLRRAGQISD